MIPIAIGMLDESLPRKLKKYFEIEHEVYTVRDKGWLGLKNGSLLKLMVENGFQVCNCRPRFASSTKFTKTSSYYFCSMCDGQPAWNFSIAHS